MTSFVFGLDGGQTTTKAAVCDLQGRVLAHTTGSGWDHMINPAGRRRCRAAFREVVGRLLPAIQGWDCRAVCLGVTSGVYGDVLLRRWARQVLGTTNVVVVPDVVTNFRGADPTGNPGVVVIAGGGSNSWGRSADGRQAKAGGHGYLLDDEGSGYELGRQAIIAALKAAHGRRPPTALTEVVLRHFQAEDITQVRNMVYTGKIGRGDIAALVPALAEVAAAGDEAAIAILADGARSLAEMAGAVIRRLDLPDAPVYPTGGVFRVGSLILTLFAAALAAAHPTAVVRQPRLPPLGGALVLALEGAGALTVDAVERLHDGLQDIA
jgi:glucosamine kinase